MIIFFVIFTRHSISKEECEALIEAADADGDGNIDYEEFGNMLYAKAQKAYNRRQRSTISGQRSRKESVMTTDGISHGPRRLAIPSILTTYVSLLGVCFLIACLILLY